MWQPIESAPQDGSTILICGNGTRGYWVADAEWRDGGWMLFDPGADSYSYESYTPTHWMPLPEPPR